MLIRYHIQADAEAGNFERVRDVLINLGLVPSKSFSYQANPDLCVLVWNDPSGRNLDYEARLYRDLYSQSRRIIVDDYNFFYCHPEKIDEKTVDEFPLELAIQKSMKMIKGQVYELAKEEI